jgi:hypothetical protein
VYERSINEAELILSTQKDSQAPVRKIWEEVVRRSKADGFEATSLPDFSAMLEGDRRFIIIPAQIKSQETLDASADAELDDLEMDRLGFFSEDQVKLRIARVIESTVSEDDEEIGSIRRRAFVSHSVKTNTVNVKKNGSAASPKTVTKEKSIPRKSKVIKKIKPTKSQKSKLRTRSKK